jgi:GrpB-like predicted nucleotidyltransferase (UPF0157 family)
MRVATGEAMSEQRQAELDAISLGGADRHEGPVRLVPFDPAWPSLFEREAARIRAVLGDRILALEHVGSTSVPGLIAKPIIDIVLAVSDSANEPAYVPDLEAAGYRLVIREPAWHEHRMLKGPDTDVHLHVFTVGSIEIRRMTAFRDRLRAHGDERAAYAAEKRVLAARTWAYVQDYADAKATIVEAILARGDIDDPAAP